MGACYSSNNTKIKATTYNRQKKSTSCSQCCESVKNDPLIKPQLPIVNNPNIRSTYNINYKQGKINDYIDRLISNNQSPITLNKINFIQLYNIFMEYTFNFTESDFIVCDTREKKNNNFLTNFSQINYQPRQVDNMTQDKLSRFKNYLKNKKIIFILSDETSFDIFEQFIAIFSIHYDLNLKNIYVVSEQIDKLEVGQIKQTNLEYLKLFIDEDSLYEYTPKILINAIDIKSSNLNYNNNCYNDSLIFVTKYPHKVNTDPNKIHLNKFDINNICNEDLNEENIFLKFFVKFKIENILNFISEEKNENENQNIGLITHSKANRIKIKGEEKETKIEQINISVSKNIIEFSEFYNLIKSDFDSIIEDCTRQIINNNTLIIEFDDEIDNKIKMKLLFIIAYKITGLSFDDIEKYLKDNFYIMNEQGVWPNKEELLNFFN